MTPEVTAWRKQERARLIEARRALTASERDRATAAICANLDALLSGLPIRSLGLYWPIKGELDLRPWADRLAAARGIELALPVVVREHAPVEYWRWRMGAPLQRGFWGIMVPAERDVIVPDALIAPLIGHSDHYRLGFGGGYFDRTLAALSPRPFAVGVGLASGRLDGFEPQPHDIPMNAIVTEAGITR
jgi:5,10-methenyltetrahydrofolate synthetase